MNKLIRILTLLCFLSFLEAEEEKDFVVLPQEKVHEGDYFVTGGSIEISGIVIGDVYAFGSRIIVNGQVEGDVIATGGTIEISGQVGGNARLAGGQIELSGVIRRNVTAVGGNIQSDPISVIQGNAVFTGGIIDLAGSIDGSLTLTASNARLLGRVGKNLKAYVGQLRLGPRAIVRGDFEYSSSHEMQMDPGAQIEGNTTYHTSAVGTFFEGKWRKGLVFGSKLTGVLMSLLFSFVIGWILIRLFPVKVKATMQLLQKKPWKAFWVGLLVLFALPIACLILFITILGFPLALALLAFSLLTFYTAKIFPIIWLSNRFFSKIGLKPNTLLIFFCGLAVFILITQIPTIGGLISFAFTLLGLGALVLSRASYAKAARKKIR